MWRNFIIAMGLGVTMTLLPACGGSDADDPSSGGETAPDSGGETTTDSAVENQDAAISRTPDTTEPTGDGSDDLGPETPPDDGCPDEHFINHSDFIGPGAEYPAPSLEVTCEGGMMTVVSNGLPHYTYVPLTPNGLEAQEFEWTISLDPKVADETSAIPLLGTIGFGVSGAP
ncbi:MAG: hypothetical protein VX938_10885, partial [Myxococcota bacterium]|nr:hypothetical protein [Myxococcota bacterium]